MKEFFNQVLSFLGNIPSFVWVIAIVLLLIIAAIHIIVLIKIKKLIAKARNSRIVGIAKRKFSNNTSPAIETIEADVYEYGALQKPNQLSNN